MSFKIKRTNTFKAKVEASVPNDQGGFDKGDFQAEFKRLDRTQYSALMESQPTDPDFIDTVLVGVSGLGDESGEFDNATAIAAIKGDLALSSAVIRTFVETSTGAAEKNSKPSRRN